MEGGETIENKIGSEIIEQSKITPDLKAD
jgi:hypothetical protein